MNSLLIILSFCLFSTTLYSQSNFKKGFIVDSDSDTLRGLIDDRSDVRNSRLVYFKTDKNSEQIKYLPTQLNLYHVGGKTYESLKISLNDTSATLFMRIIDKGPVSLYFGKDAQSNSFYFAEKNGKLYKLTNDVSYIWIEDNKYAKESRKYLSILNYLTSDCSGYSALETDYEFTLDEMASLVKKYNRCKDPELMLSRYYEPPVIRSQLLIYTGVNFANIVARGESKINKTTSLITPGFGLRLKFYPTKFNSKISFDIGLEYNQKGTDAQPKDIMFDLKYLNFHSLAVYNYPKGRWRPFVGFGFMGGVLLDEEDNVMTQLSENGERTALFPDANSNMEFGFIVETGLKYVLPGEDHLFIIAGLDYSMINFSFITHTYFNRVYKIRAGYAINLSK